MVYAAPPAAIAKITANVGQQAWVCPRGISWDSAGLVDPRSCMRIFSAVERLKMWWMRSLRNGSRPDEPEAQPYNYQVGPEKLLARAFAARQTPWTTSQHAVLPQKGLLREVTERTEDYGNTSLLQRAEHTWRNIRACFLFKCLPALFHGLEVPR